MESALYHIGRKERNVLFNDALNTFYLRLYLYHLDTALLYHGLTGMRHAI